VPFVSPEITIGDAEPLAVLVGSSTAVTVYEVAVEEIGPTPARNETLATPSPEDAKTDVGTGGNARGVTAADAAEAGESPRELVAFTVNV